jgi:hypothetical protein
MIISSQSSALANVRNTARAKESAPSESVSVPADQVQLGGSEVAPGVYREAIPGSFIVVADKDEVATLNSNPGLQVEKVLGQAGDETFLLVQAAEGSVAQLQESFSEVMPNYQYSGNVYDDPIASSENGPAPAGRPRHLDIINIDPAWAVTKGTPSTVTGVTDGGVDLKHPELQDSIFKHPGEIAGNGIDDDKNGKVDDVSGWDFTDEDNVADGEGSDHHTHVHGIAHAREGDSGATGVAPGAKSMPLRIDGGRRAYSSALVSEAYLYAMNNGAKSTNTSYNIDGFPGDRAIERTYRTLADNDVLVFNSAGNSGRLNPARSVFEDIVLVASTDTNPASVDKRSSFSNYGVGIDIASPGKDIVSTLPNGRVGSLSGTSMASPGAMGLHALVQSAHPEWNREQRWAQIFGTADNIDDKNPREAGLFGGGRINAGRALTETLPAPTVNVQETKNANGGTTKLTVRFEKILSGASANTQEAWQVLNDKGEVVLKGAPKEIRLLTNQFDINVGSLPAGSYEFVASADILKDPFGQALDGDRDGKAGGNHVTRFEVK